MNDSFGRPILDTPFAYNLQFAREAKKIRALAAAPSGQSDFLFVRKGGTPSSVIIERERRERERGERENCSFLCVCKLSFLFGSRQIQWLALCVLVWSEGLLLRAPAADISLLRFRRRHRLNLLHSPHTRFLNV